MASKYAFVHIPRTSGRAFWNILVNHCVTHMPKFTASNYTLMLNYIDQPVDEYTLYGGHTFYKILKDVLPTSTKYITLLRDPFNRIYSQWDFIYRGHAFPRYGVENELTFSEFIRHEKFLPLASNFQARYLTNKPTVDFETGVAIKYQVALEQAELAFDESELYARALASLNEFAVVGIHEELKFAIADVCALMGIPVPVNMEIKLPTHVISDDDRDYLEMLNQVDLRLHRDREWRN